MTERGSLKRLFDSAEDASAKRVRQSSLAPYMTELDEHGFTVIPDVLTEAECVAGRDGLERYMINCGIEVHDPRLRHSHYPSIHGIVQHLEIGHCRAVWDVRQNQRVVDVFEEMYGTNDLLVSFDGACMMLPYARDNPKQRWTHVDQSHKRLGRRCIQGYVNLSPSTDERTGSLAVLPGSHKKHTAFARAHPAACRNNEDWYKFNDAEIAELDCGELVRVHGAQGSLVLWDSRTGHQNVAPPRSVRQALPRHVVYVCYQPRARASAAALAKKAEAFDEYRMTTHWPASRVKLFPATWRTYGEKREFTIVRDRVSTPRMLELAGVTPLTTRTRRATAPLLDFVA